MRREIRPATILAIIIVVIVTCAFSIFTSKMIVKINPKTLERWFGLMFFMIWTITACIGMVMVGKLSNKRNY